MSPLEIALLAAGALIFILSFVIPVKKKEASGEVREMIEDEVKLKVKTEIDELRSHIDDVVDEAIDYAQEKTERSLERICNEKIMAVNEYSETVLDEINKNHKEVMFLYDMLTDKHEDLKSAVSEAAVATKNAKETAKEVTSAAEAAVEAAAVSAEAAAESLSDTADQPGTEKTFVNEKLSMNEKPAGEVPVKKVSEPSFRTLKWAEFAMEQADEAYEGEKNAGQVKKATPDVKESIAINVPKVPVFKPAIPETGSNNGQVNETDRANARDQVIALHKLGKSDVDIARELNMGVGEVSLIIGLHAK